MDSNDLPQKQMASVAKGGYCWAKDDLSHALQAMMKDRKDNDPTRQILCSLLSNPGTGLPRPGKRKRPQIGMRAETSNSLLKHVIEQYYGRNGSNSARNNLDGMKDLLDDVHRIAGLKNKFAFNPTGDNLQRNYEQRKEELISDVKCKIERDVIQYFLKPETLLKLSYAIQLYNHFKEIFSTDSSSEDMKNHSKKTKHVSFLKKLIKLARLDMQILKILILMLFEPMRRQIIVPLDENRCIYWLKFMLKQPDGIQSIHLDEADNFLRCAIVDTFSSWSGNAEDPNICKVDLPILMLVCKSSFPLAKICIGDLIKITLCSLEAIPSRVMVKVSDIHNEKDASIDYNFYVSQLKHLVQSDSMLKSLFLTLHHVCFEGEAETHIGEMEKHERKFQRHALIKIREEVLK